jgi:hypothetical protein
MLSCERRRQVVHYLSQQQKVVSLYDLSKQLAAWENDVAVEAVSYDQRMCVYTALRQSHLPKLAAEGIIEYDPDAGTVVLTDAASQLDVYLDVVPHDEIPWSTYYLGLSAIAAALAACIHLGLSPFGLLSPLSYTYFLAFVLLVSALVHTHHERENRIGREGAPPG